LLAFYSIPPQVDGPTPEAGPPDWGPLFAEARIDPALLRPVASTWTPAFFCDARAAWEGAYPDRPEIPIRVEAAAYRGRPVSFFIVAPWTRPERMEPHLITPVQRALVATLAVLLVLLVGAGSVLARRNIRSGRGDRRGAFRLALSMFALGVLAWGFAAHHVADIGAELALAARGASAALLLAAILWLFYLALEPSVRRLRPHTLVSWAHLLAGGLRDTVVGRDALIGGVWGALLALVLPLVASLPQWLDQPPLNPRLGHYETLLGSRERLAYSFVLLIDSIEISMGALLLFLLLRLMLGRDKPASLALVAVFTAIQAVGQSEMLGQGLWLLLPLNLLIMGSYTWLLLRFGLLSAIVGAYVVDLLMNFPLSTELGSWKGGPTVFVMLLLGALAVSAFRISLAPGRPGRRPPLLSSPT